MAKKTQVTTKSEDLKVHIRGEDGEIIYKIIIIGDPSIGKTSSFGNSLKINLKSIISPPLESIFENDLFDLTIQGKDTYQFNDLGFSG